MVIDYKNSNEIKLPSGKVLVAIDEEELDKDGNFIPTIEKKIIIDGLPLELAFKPELIVEALAEYIVFFNGKIRCLPDGPIYDGRNIMKVREFKKIPNRRFPINVKDENGFGYSVDIQVRCFGHSEAKDKKKAKAAESGQAEAYGYGDEV